MSNTIDLSANSQASLVTALDSVDAQGTATTPTTFVLNITPGATIGSTDEFGLRAVENKAHVHDIHASILHLLGLDHLKLTFPRDGREERLTVNGGRLIEGLLA